MRRKASGLWARQAGEAGLSSPLLREPPAQRPARPTAPSNATLAASSCASRARSPA
jgi:hypothetical protein